MIPSDELKSIVADAVDFARSTNTGCVRKKGHQDFVSQLDEALEERIRAALRQLTPDVPVLGEETHLAGRTIGEPCWLVDPLDGTGNFVAGLPFSAVSVALLDRHASTLQAAVADISSGDIYIAYRGKGAWLNGEKLVAPDFAPPLMALSSGVVDLLACTPDLFIELRRLAKLRNLGVQSLHLCYVARGAFAFAASREARLWDDAAGRLIASESGAFYKSYCRLYPSKNPSAEQHSLCVAQYLRNDVCRIFERLFEQIQKEPE